MKRCSLSVCLALFCLSFSFAQGYYSLYELKLEGIGSGIVENYFQDGNTRKEVVIKGSLVDKRIVTITLKDTPDVEYLLHDEGKTYETNDLSKKPDFSKGEVGDYKITVLEKDTMDCYLSTHVKILNLKDSMQLELWTSPDVEHYKEYMEINDKYQQGNLGKALAANRAPGFPVRIDIPVRSGTLRLDLVRFAIQDNPESLFDLKDYIRVYVPKPTSSGGQDASK